MKGLKKGDIKRIFLIVLDSCGIGEEPDAKEFGDHDCNTMKRISEHPAYKNDVMKKLGLANIDGQDYLGVPDEKHLASIARMRERSRGKDTTIGHWEISGVVSDTPLPTYPEGFPEEILKELREATGRGILCNLPYSGTDVIRDYGEEHLRTGDLILYTSADSVAQIAAHEDLVPPEELYEICRKARKIFSGKHAVGRIIARPFIGNNKDDFKRTSHRHDFSLEPPRKTMLDAISEAGKDVYAIGKINDIFAGQGITEHVYTSGNTEGMKLTLEALDKDFEGLCFTNLVDFDMLYGHRQDVEGYARAFAEFNDWLPSFMEKMQDTDVLMITADHGCDPGDDHTDHTREYIPFIAYGKHIEPINYHTRPTFSDIAATVTDLLQVDYPCDGVPLDDPHDTADLDLCDSAIKAMEKAYVPYSSYHVGAAVLTKSGKIFTGCNIENAAYSPTVCAERTAIFKAVSEGEREFVKIAVCGGKDGKIEGVFPPCGVCRQVMSEFCEDDFEILLIEGNKPLQYKRMTLKELLPERFSPKFIKV